MMVSDTAQAHDSFSALDRALNYVDRGWAPVPVQARSKAPRIRNWPSLRINKENAAQHFNGVGNIGIILGEASGGLTDVDLDCPEAIDFAPKILPTTNATFGRASKLGSHRLYRVLGAAPSVKFEDPATGRILLELRGDGGFQTVFPESIHPSGEPIEWECDGDPATVEYPILRTSAARLAARCLVARYLPEVTDGAELLTALDTTDPRVANQVRQWLELPEPSAPEKKSLAVPMTTSRGDNPILLLPSPIWAPAHRTSLLPHKARALPTECCVGVRVATSMIASVN